MLNLRSLLIILLVPLIGVGALWTLLPDEKAVPTAAGSPSAPARIVAAPDKASPSPRASAESATTRPSSPRVITPTSASPASEPDPESWEPAGQPAPQAVMLITAAPASDSPDSPDSPEMTEPSSPPANSPTTTASPNRSATPMSPSPSATPTPPTPSPSLSITPTPPTPSPTPMSPSAKPTSPFPSATSPSPSATSPSPSTESPSPSATSPTPSPSQTPMSPSPTPISPSPSAPPASPSPTPEPSLESPTPTTPPDDAPGGEWAARLGATTNDQETIAGGSVQRFANGSLYLTETGTTAVLGEIDAAYRDADAHLGPLGLPTGNEKSIDGASVQQFQNGTIYLTATGPQTVSGDIWQAYRDADAHDGPLGLPTSNARQSGSGTVQTFESGDVTWRNDVGAIVHVGVAEVVPYTKQATFIAAIAPMAQASQSVYGVPASVTIAQAILESGWGGSTLSRYGQAYFGVKCSSSNYGQYASACIPLPTWEVINGADVTVSAYFRSYDSLTDSILDHGHFLRNNSRYAAAFNTTDPAQFARAIHAAGYATDPAYASKLISIIDSFDLRRFDDGVRAGTVPVTGTIGALYQSMGGQYGPLGTGVGIESDGPVDGSRLVSFDTGVIISLLGTGAHAVTGDIWDRYRLDPDVRKVIGAPTGDQFSVGAAHGQEFGDAMIFATAPDRTYVVSGDINTAYQQAGGHAGRLGLPTSDEDAYGAGIIQYFEGGSIVYADGTGAVVRG